MGSTCLITPTSSYKMCKTLKSNKVDLDIQRTLFKRKANHDQYKQVQTRCLDRDEMVNFETCEYLRKMILQSVKQVAQKKKSEYSQ